MVVDMFLKIDGIPGESTDNNHRDEIDVVFYTWGESQTVVSSSAGGSAGRVTMQDFHFAMRVSKASPKLLLACASGAHIRNAILTVRRPGGNPVEFFKWTLSDVIVASYQTASNVPTGEPPFPKENWEAKKSDSANVSSQTPILNLLHPASSSPGSI